MARPNVFTALDDLVVLNKDLPAKKIASLLGKTVGSVYQRRMTLKRKEYCKVDLNVIDETPPSEEYIEQVTLVQGWDGLTEWMEENRPDFVYMFRIQLTVAHERALECLETKTRGTP